MKLSLTEIIPKVFLITTKSHAELCATIARMQEFYENEEFTKKLFTWKHLKTQWKKDHEGKWSYSDTWAGFNFPGSAMVPFMRGWFNPLAKKEKQLLELVQKEVGFENIAQCYFIAVADRYRDDALTHEIAHGLFYTNEKYRESVLCLLKRHDIDYIRNELRVNRYGEHTLYDEANAYLISGITSSLNMEADELLRESTRYLFRRFCVYPHSSLHHNKRAERMVRV